MVKISKKTCVYTIINIIIIAITYFLMDFINNYHNSSVIGTICVLILVLINVLKEKKIMSPKIIILVFFILFQFGWPILNAFNENYTNWYLTQFSKENLISSVWYSLICIEFFSLGLIVIDDKKSGNFKKIYFLSDENSKLIYSFAKILLLITFLVAFPIGIYTALQSRIFGYNYTKTITYGMFSAIVRFSQTMIVPAFLLCLLYGNKKNNKFYLSLLLLYALILIVTGARTTALALIMVILIMKNDSTSIDKSKLIKKIIIILGAVIIVYGAVMVAQYRYYGYIKSISIISVINSLVEEMGFNFTTINFVKIFVPTDYDFQYGKMYLNSIICLIPKTLDFTGTITEIYNNLPELQLAKWLSMKYGSVYDFGVGYSVIAEAYYNLGNFGFISVFIQGIIIGKFLVENKGEKSLFSLYIRYIMLFSLITYPRRSFSTLLKSIEYCIILVVLVIGLLSKKKNKT